VERPPHASHPKPERKPSARADASLPSSRSIPGGVCGPASSRADRPPTNTIDDFQGRDGENVVSRIYRSSGSRRGWFWGVLGAEIGTPHGDAASLEEARIAFEAAQWPAHARRCQRIHPRSNCLKPRLPLLGLVVARFGGFGSDTKTKRSFSAAIIVMVGDL
jgi:hypothetical protein